MENSIQIVEKPDWVSWEAIKECLEHAHEANRSKGINVLHFKWQADELKEALGEDGVMFVALDGQKVVGTAAIIVKEGHTWYTPGRYGYLGFSCVLPDYNGMGIYKQLTLKREEFAREKGLAALCLFTHENNTRVQQIALKNGYQYVRYFLMSNREHFDVVMVRWLDGCPFSEAYCRRRFKMSKIKAHLMKVAPACLVDRFRSSSSR